jgi:hypothetical protein
MILYGFPRIDSNKRKATEVTVDGTSSAETVVSAERGGVITGKITYPDGEPAVGAQINVFMKEGKRWSHAQFVSSGAQTDDRGIYRIYPLERHCRWVGEFPEASTWRVISRCRAQ